jgi:hypothetical protein
MARLILPPEEELQPRVEEPPREVLRPQSINQIGIRSEVKR